MVGGDRGQLLQPTDLMQNPPGQMRVQHIRSNSAMVKPAGFGRELHDGSRMAEYERVFRRLRRE